MALGPVGKAQSSDLAHSLLLDSLPSSSHCFLHSTSAEAVAMGLLKQFEGMQLPAASELEWLVPEHDAPQKVGFSRSSMPGSL